MMNFAHLNYFRTHSKNEIMVPSMNFGEIVSMKEVVDMSQH